MRQAPEHKEPTMAKARKIELPAQLDAAYPVPEDATVAELSEMIEQCNKDANALVAEDSTSKEAVAQRVAKANWYIETIHAIEARQDDLAAASAADAEALAAARAALASKAQTDPDETGGEGGEGGGTDPADPAEAAPPPVVSGDANAALPDPVLVAAAAGAKPSGIAAAAAAGASRMALRDKRVESGQVAYLTAAAGGEIRAGEKIDWSGAGAMATRMFGALPKTKGAPTAKLGISTLHVPTVDERLVASASNGDFALVEDAVEWAVSMDRIKAESGEDSLTAAGWCAPSETLYDLIDLTTTDGLLDLPGITVTRGGVRFSLGPDFSTVYGAGQLFTQTEAQNISGTHKPVANIPCPTFTDHRMNIDGIYLTGDILSQKGYPEAYADFLRKSLTAFAHYRNAATIADMVTLATLVDYSSTNPDTPPKMNKAFTIDLLGVVEFQATDMRYKNRLSESAPLEAVFPLWMKGAFRSDLAKRLGVEDGQAITDSLLVSYLALRGINAQFVYDWQDALTSGAAGFGAALGAGGHIGANQVLTWPTTVEFLLYPQGTFVQATSDVIELSAVYDSTLLTTNQYVALFLEQGRLTLQRSWDARLVKLPVTVSGATAAGVDYTGSGFQPTV